MKLINGLALSCLSTVISVAQGFLVMSLGRCPNIPSKTNFDITKFLGLWYNYENFDTSFQWGTTCAKSYYSLKNNGRIRVVNIGFRDIRIYGRALYRSLIHIEGEGYVVDARQPGGLNLQFDGQPDFGGGKANYIIVDTDYDSYGVVYSCSQMGILKTELAWILTRQQGMMPPNESALKTKLRNYGVDTLSFKRIDHSNC